MKEYQNIYERIYSSNNKKREVFWYYDSEGELTHKVIDIDYIRLTDAYRRSCHGWTNKSIHSK